LQNEIKERKKESNWYHVILDGKRQTMDSMKKELIRLRNLIDDTRNSKDYQRVEKIAEERVNATLQVIYSFIMEILRIADDIYEELLRTLSDTILTAIQTQQKDD